MKKKWMILASMVLVLSLLFVILSEPEYQAEYKAEEAIYPPASVEQVAMGTHQGELSFYAEVKPRWSVALKAHVRGEITQLSALAGMSVKQGQLLAVIEDSAYQTQYAEAAHGVAAAKLRLLEEEVRFKARNKKHSSMLEPRLEVARRALTTANVRLKEAETRLSYTRITAPFSGYVTRRAASIGQTVEAGEPLLDLLNTDILDIEVALTQEEWLLLADNWQQMQARLEGNNQRHLGQAKVKRGGGFVDPKTRQYRVFLEVNGDASSREFVPGEFIQVKLPTRSMPDSLNIPETALSRNGYVWYVDHQDRLGKFKARVLFHADNRIVIARPDDSDRSQWRIVHVPLASYLPGSQVRPVIKGE